MNHKDAWARLKSYVDTREVDVTIENGDSESYFSEILEYMERVEAEYGLVPETISNREG